MGSMRGRGVTATIEDNVAARADARLLNCFVRCLDGPASDVPMFVSPRRHDSRRSCEPDLSLRATSPDVVRSYVRIFETLTPFASPGRRVHEQPAAAARPTPVLHTPHTVVSESAGELYERAAAITGDALLGLRIGLLVFSHTLGLLPHVMGTAATLGAALERGQERFGVRRSWPFEVQRAHDTTTLFPENDPRLGEQTTQVGVGLSLGMLRSFLGERSCASFVQFPTAPPHAQARREIVGLVGCNVGFSFERPGISFPSELLDAPLISADIEVNEALLSLWRRQQTIAASSTDNQDRFVASLERASAEILSEGALNVQRLARKVGLGPRTLQRRLSAAGLSFRELADATRRRECLRLLCNSSLSLDEIAARTGFQTTAGFHRAFKRWTGKTPRSLRTRGA